MYIDNLLQPHFLNTQLEMWSEQYRMEKESWHLSKNFPKILIGHFKLFQHSSNHVMAHNFQGYDDYFILQYWDENGFALEVIVWGETCYDLRADG